MTAMRNRMSDKKHKIIDGDGHVVEDHPAIVAHMPEMYRDRFGTSRGAYPPNDHLIRRTRTFFRRAPSPRSGAKVGSISWRTSASLARFSIRPMGCPSVGS